MAFFDELEYISWMLLADTHVDDMNAFLSVLREFVREVNSTQPQRLAMTSANSTRRTYPLEAAYIEDNISMYQIVAALKPLRQGINTQIL